MIAALFALMMTALGLTHPAPSPATAAGHGHVVTGDFGGEVSD